MIPQESLSRLIGVMVSTVVVMMNCFAVFDPLIKTSIQVPIVIWSLSLMGVVLPLKKIENDHPEGIRWM